MPKKAKKSEPATAAAPTAAPERVEPEVILWGQEEENPTPQTAAELSSSPEGMERRERALKMLGRPAGAETPKDDSSEGSSAAAPAESTASNAEVASYGADSNMEDADVRRERALALLNRKPGDAKSAEEPTTAAETEETPAIVTNEAAPAEEAPVEEQKPPTRKGMLDKIKAERERLGIEATLKTERAERERLEKLVKNGSALELLQARGLTREQALEQLMTAPDEAPAANGSKAPTSNDPEVEQLKKDMAAFRQQQADANYQKAVTIVNNVTADMDIPMTRAAKAIPVPMDDGRTRFVSGTLLIMETANALATQAGDNNVTGYLKHAAELVEQHLEDQNKDLIAAYNAKKSKAPTAPAKPAAAPAKKPAVAALGKKAGGGAPAKAQSADDLSMDREERRLQIREQFFGAQR